MDVLCLQALNMCNFFRVIVTFMKIYPIRFWTFMVIKLKFWDRDINISEFISIPNVRTFENPLKSYLIYIIVNFVLDFFSLKIYLLWISIKFIISYLHFYIMKSKTFIWHKIKILKININNFKNNPKIFHIHESFHYVCIHLISLYRALKRVQHNYSS